MDSEPGPQATIRREVIEYGSLPIAAWLHHIDSAAAIQALLRHLVDVGEADGSHCMVDITTLASCLDVPQQHAQILVDTLEAVAAEHQAVVRRAPGGTEASAVDAHAVALFLFAQLYIRQAQRPDAMDVWPSPTPAGEAPMAGGSVASGANSGGLGLFLEPSSPTLQRAGSGAAGASPRGGGGGLAHFSAVHFTQQKSNQAVRKELQAHLATHQGLLGGYTDYLQRHTGAMLQLCLSRPPPADASSGHAAVISAGDFDRLGLLMRGPAEAAAAGAASDLDGSPMDVSPTPFQDDGWRLSLAVPLFTSPAESGEAPLPAAAEWLAANIHDEQQPAEAMCGSPTRGDRWHNLPPAGIVQGGAVDVQGVCKSTVVRGEDDFPDGLLRITDCHDCVVYALAPLQYATVAGCSDCTVVVGAVGRLLRVERCERLQLVAAATRICIATCHDCVFYLGVNRPPLLIGDNRFLQMAPYNTQYERLSVHLSAAGVAAEPNMWDCPVTLAREHRRATPDSDATTSPGGGASVRQPATLLPPDRLLPFMVPFHGGPGPLCGGAASGGAARMAADLGSFVGLGDGGGIGGGSLAPSPFRLPPAYEEAKERKVAAVAELRNAVKAAALDDGRKRELQAVIQSYFKDWLMGSGHMREACGGVHLGSVVFPGAPVATEADSL
ncbi:hypothetical protein WJX81_002320 [Elliptochloris bilobata]|uniref:TBCC domain-containing protein 1 n=1 Tax=Elliptochloris bilobata TaxID=381761 RepID=A0AAW1RZV8_9CHLO